MNTKQQHQYDNIGQNKTKKIIETKKNGLV
jgi:hypothetical protein